MSDLHGWVYWALSLSDKPATAAMIGRFIREPSTSRVRRACLEMEARGEIRRAECKTNDGEIVTAWEV